jgi:hypothetical protein
VGPSSTPPDDTAGWFDDAVDAEVEKTTRGSGGTLIGTPARAVKLVATVVAITIATNTPLTTADDKVLLGGGAGIAVGGDTLCTLTTIGHDSTGELVGFTSAHCGGPGSQVSAEGGPVVGSVVSADEELDYAVIKFDPAEVTPIPDFDGFPINGIGPDPGLGQGECHHSRASGRSCASITLPGPDPDTLRLRECGNPDDAGAPVTVNDMLVGMIRGGFTPRAVAGCPAPYFPAFPPAAPLPHPLGDQPEAVSINAILADANVKGGPGAGFVPVGA